MTEWIPPDRPLVGDRGYTHLYDDDDDDEKKTKQQRQEEEELAQIEREVKLLEEETKMTEEEQLQRIEQELKILEEIENNNNNKNDLKKKKKKVVVQPIQQQNIDWMKTRREALGVGDDRDHDHDENAAKRSSSNNTTSNLTPSFGRRPQHYNLEVKHHTLLTATEIMDLLESLGGEDPNLIEDQQLQNEYGDTRLGGAYKGLIFVTGSSTAHIRMLATTLVEQMKLRKLHEVGVMGAKFGAEGMEDDNSNWMSVDCNNYAVTIQDARTRKLMDLENWWSNPDPLGSYQLSKGLVGKKSKKKWRKTKRGNTKLADEQYENAMDEFVSQNPVPPDYGINTTNNNMMTTTSSDSWDDTIHQLENKRWTAPHRAVVPKPMAGRRSSGRGGKKKRRNR